VHDSATLESALSATASLVMAGIRARIHVRVVTTSGIDTGFGSTGAHGAAALDVLAAAEARPGSSLLDDLRLGAGTGPLTVITTQSASDAELAAVTRAGARARTTLVVFERPGEVREGFGLARHPSRCRLVAVRAGTSFRAAWEGAPC
jgi:uncharacterized protein (DUF58 family)